VDGDKEQGLAERREGLEAHRVGALDEEDAGEAVPLPAAGEDDVGDGAEGGELVPARVEEIERVTGVV
jgi:hypothetical protein